MIKFYKSFLFIVVLVLVTFTNYGCGKCNGEEPILKITNESGSSISVVVHIPGSSTDKTFTVSSKSSSSYESYKVGNLYITANNTTSYSLNTTYCHQYELIFTTTGTFFLDDTDRNESSSSGSSSSGSSHHHHDHHH